MIGEFGGIGCFQEGHMWTPKGCHTYLHVPDAANESATYVQMVDKIIAERKDVSCKYSIQCGGLLHFTRHVLIQQLVVVSLTVRVCGQIRFTPKLPTLKTSATASSIMTA